MKEKVWAKAKSQVFERRGYSPDTSQRVEAYIITAASHAHTAAAAMIDRHRFSCSLLQQSDSTSFLVPVAFVSAPGRHNSVGTLFVGLYTGYNQAIQSSIMPLPFTPQYSHPFTFEELCELEVPIIAAGMFFLVFTLIPFGSLKGLPYRRGS